MRIKYVYKVNYCCTKMKDHIQMAHIRHFENTLHFGCHLQSGDSFEEVIKFCPFCGEEVEVDCEIEDEVFNK